MCTMSPYACVCICVCRSVCECVCASAEGSEGKRTGFLAHAECGSCLKTKKSEDRNQNKRKMRWWMSYDYNEIFTYLYCSNSF